MTRATIEPMRQGRAWGAVCVHEWMWAPEGLGLGHGADLFVYAALYAATDAGALTYRSSCAALGATIGYARETVQRSLTHLCSLDLVWSPDGRTSSGGTPRTYAISPGPIARACGEQCHGSHDPSSTRLSAMTNDETIADIAPDDSSSRAVRGIPVANATIAHGAGTLAAGLGSPMSGRTVSTCLNDPSRLASGRDASSPGVTTSCERVSRTGSDDLSRPLAHHTPKNLQSPAAMSVFDGAPISSFLSSSDMSDTSGEACLQKECVRTLTLAEFAAFETLVANSLLPVDDAFLDRNLEAFQEVVASGVPADAIVEAYDDYAAYQRRRYRLSGTWRPMHLLHWLQANPNGNVDFVMRKREIESLRTSGLTARTCRCTSAVANPEKKQTTGRRGPRLTQCRDRGRALWFVDDDHGSRRVEGAEGVEDLDEATRIYEQMYERECRANMLAA